MVCCVLHNIIQIFKAMHHVCSEMYHEVLIYAVLKCGVMITPEIGANWLHATGSTSICSLMFTPTMQYMTYHLREQFVID